MFDALMSFFKRGQSEPEYSEPDVTDEVWIRKDGKLIKLEVSDDDAEKGQ